MTAPCDRAMPSLTDLEEFVTDHRPHGALTGDVTEPEWERLPDHDCLPRRGHL